MKKNDLNKIERLNQLLNIDGKHTQYQELPIEILNESSSLKELKIGGYQDFKRFEWLCKHCETLEGKVVDIGANQGFFSFSVLNKFPVNVTAYEPFNPHSEGIEILRDLMDYDKTQLNVINQGIGIDQIELLENSELLIFLNVLHHAGKEFDNSYIKNINDWENYAIDYLKKLKTKTKKMFFQLGYAWGGESQRLCDDSEIIDFTSNLLIKAGWNILKIGLITEYKDPIEYCDYNYSDIPNLKSLQLNNTLFNKILRKVSPKKVSMPHRFAQRPLWLCN